MKIDEKIIQQRICLEVQLSWLDLHWQSPDSEASNGKINYVLQNLKKLINIECQTGTLIQQHEVSPITTQHLVHLQVICRHGKSQLSESPVHEKNMYQPLEYRCPSRTFVYDSARE